MTTGSLPSLHYAYKRTVKQLAAKHATRNDAILARATRPAKDQRAESAETQGPSVHYRYNQNKKQAKSHVSAQNHAKPGHMQRNCKQLVSLGTTVVL